MDTAAKLTAKQYASDQEVRWCPGCGDYAILKAMQKALADLQADPANTVFVSGIGCAARFPYYMETYGFHTIHGRAAAIATGVKLGNPNLDVWVVAGDGDALSIGGNHLIHLLRRNVDLQFLLFNNEIYGLTKGQYSPTSRAGTRSPSSPWGSVESPVHALSLALGAGARFVARATDVGQPHLIEMLKQARAHKGTSLVEILQNCIVYNDGVHAAYTERDAAADRVIYVEHGKPLTFGADRQFALRLNPKRFGLEAVPFANLPAAEVLMHDETNLALAQMLARGDGNSLPLALGVLYRSPAPTLESRVRARIEARPHTDLRDLQDLFGRGHTWDIKAPGTAPEPA
jgi:2-oxoglutarate ferredoxin oxidoreductase subunit beta